MKLDYKPFKADLTAAGYIADDPLAWRSPSPSGSAARSLSKARPGSARAQSAVVLFRPIRLQASPPSKANPPDFEPGARRQTSGTRDPAPRSGAKGADALERAAPLRGGACT
jgi:hypothetical protein